MKFLSSGFKIFIAIFLAIFSFAQIAFLPAVALAKVGASPITSQNIIELTNQKRVKNEAVPLTVSPQLTVAAQNKAFDMVKRNYWSHQTPEGLPFWIFAEKENYDWLYLGENLAADFQTSEGIVNAWFLSSSHQKNILNENYQDIGIGISENVVVTLYGQRSQHIIHTLSNNLITTVLKLLDMFLF